jgi:hypothetical protein
MKVLCGKDRADVTGHCFLSDQLLAACRDGRSGPPSKCPSGEKALRSWCRGI